MNKASKQKPAGKLMPLPIPGGKWWTVTMDFITGLPKTEDGKDAILVFTDKLTKMIHLVACTTACTAEGAAELFISEVVRLHGIPHFHVCSFLTEMPNLLQWCIRVL